MSDDIPRELLAAALNAYGRPMPDSDMRLIIRACAPLIEARAALTAERDEMREALEQIESASDDVDDLHMKIIARAALHQEGSR